MGIENIIITCMALFIAVLFIYIFLSRSVDRHKSELIKLLTRQNELLFKLKEQYEKTIKEL